MLGQDLINLFQDIGPLGLLLAFSLISFLDGFAIPTLPEAWLLLIAIADPGIPKWSWGVILVLVGVGSAIAAQMMLFFVVKRIGMPRRIRNIMNKYTKILVVSNEKLAFMNWLVPVVPFTGAFIAVCEWQPKRAFSYSLLGGFVKMSILVTIAVALPAFFSAEMVADVTLVLVFVILGLSLAFTYIRRRRLEREAAASSARAPGENRQG